ncbi:MAG: hypothetical protein OSB00_07775 [Sphingomonas bacterium]|nr:hypothetical protein [Sphingomonas bacterium]
MGATFVVHVDADGNQEYRAFGVGDARFLVIDERCPDDRVYRITVREPSAALTALIGASPIGDRFEERHVALAAQINAQLTGVCPLSIVRDEQ